MKVERGNTAFVVKFDAMASNQWLDPVMSEHEEIDLRSWLGWNG